MWGRGGGGERGEAAEPSLPLTLLSRQAGVSLAEQHSPRTISETSYSLARKASGMLVCLRASSKRYLEQGKGGFITVLSRMTYSDLNIKWWGFIPGASDGEKRCYSCDFCWGARAFGEFRKVFLRAEHPAEIGFHHLPRGQTCNHLSRREKWYLVTPLSAGRGLLCASRRQPRGRRGHPPPTPLIPVITQPG